MTLWRYNLLRSLYRWQYVHRGKTQCELKKATLELCIIWLAIHIIEHRAAADS